MAKKGVVPLTEIKDGLKMREPLNFGMKKWTDMFNPRQLLTHLIYLEKFLYFKNKILNDPSFEENNKELAKVVVVYGALVFDKCVDYNSIIGDGTTRSVIANTMSMQAFPFNTRYAEWNQLVENGGYLWAMEKIIESVSELVKLLPSKESIESSNDNDSKSKDIRQAITIYNSDATSIPLDDNSVDAIIVDPPYYDNVMYGETSDFFYIWLKKTVGDLFPEYFKTELTNKTDEAVANVSLYRDVSKPKEMANRHYNAKMLASFKEMKRVLKDDGILTVMFTHRKVEAWAELTKALSDAGFTFRASWPVFTEPGDKFGKMDKGNLKITILLSCRERPPPLPRKVYGVKYNVNLQEKQRRE